MDSSVYICSILDLDRLRLTLNKPPELLLDIVLRNFESSQVLSHAVRNRRREAANRWLRRMIGEPIVSEGGVSLLEAVQGVLFALRTQNQKRACQGRGSMTDDRGTKK